jgi:hypothetical protein
VRRTGQVPTGKRLVLQNLYIAGLLILLGISGCGGQVNRLVKGAPPRATSSPSPVDLTNPVSAPGTVRFPHLGIRFEPNSQPASARISSSEALQTEQQSFTLNSSDTGGIDPSIQLIYFSNDVAGNLQADGTIKLLFQHIPAWVITYQLARPVLHVGGTPGAATSADAVPSDTTQNCRFISIINAISADLIQSFQECG